MKLEFSRQIFEKHSISNFMYIRPVGAGFYADGRTDWHGEPNSRFSQYCRRP